MALMFPPELPSEVLKDPMRSSEVLVYDELKVQLNNDFHVYYSSPWLGTRSDGSEIDGEADFVVAHARKGILVIEVKGGRVSLNSRNEWTSTDRFGICRNIKNPVDQARTSKHHILKKLKEHREWSGGFISIQHGVILPHVGRPSHDFRPDMPLKLFAFEPDLKHLAEWVESRMWVSEDNSRPSDLGSVGLSALDSLLAKPISLRVRLNANIRDDMKQIRLKTNEQIFVLKEMEENKRMAVSGAAGTGKTILAMEKARMLAEHGLRTLLLCFNKPLGGHIRQAMKDEKLVTASHFHRFAKSIALCAGKAERDIDPDSAAEDFVDNFIEADIEEFDAVIIDEGQDFKDEWLAALEVCVKDAENGVLYIFYDDNQNVMSGSPEYIRNLPVAKHSLRRNFRNTKSIFRGAEPYYKGTSVLCIGPDGSDIQLNPLVSDRGLRALLNERVGSLVKTEGIEPEHIAILCPDVATINKVKDGDKNLIGKYPFTNAEDLKQGAIVIETIRRFKGLESPVVLLVVDANTVAKTELMYTGITRAQAHLELIGSKAALSVFQQFI